MTGPRPHPEERKHPKMKLKVKLACAVLLLLPHAARAQEGRKVAEPEFVGVIFFLKEETGELLPLERVNPTGKMEMKAFGFGGGKVTVTLEGEKSPVRFGLGQTLNFVVRVPNPNEDPARTVGLSAYESKKGKRVKTVVKTKPLGMGASTPESKLGPLEVKLARYGENSLRVEIKNLQPGEYCIGHVSSKSNFCFAVDSPGGGR